MAQLDLFGFGKEPESSPKKKTKEQADSKERKPKDNTTAEGDSADADLFSKEDIEISGVVENKELATELKVQIVEPAIDIVESEVVKDEIEEGPEDEIEEEISNEFVEQEQEEIVQIKDNVQVEQEENTNPVVFTDGKIGVKFKIKKLTEVQPKVEVKEIEEKPIIVKKLTQKRGRKSFKEIDAEVDLIEIPADEILFQKQYYPISMVAGWFKVNTSLLRFWENEFDVLKPRKNRKGDRMFRPEDVKNLQLIYHLLRERKYTIDGAKDYLKNNKNKADLQFQLTQTLQKFKSFLLELKSNLQS